MLWLPVLLASVPGESDFSMNAHMASMISSSMPAERYGDGHTGICEACKRMKAGGNILRLTRAEALGDWEATSARLQSGEAFVITDALGACKALVNPLLSHAYWAEHVDRILDRSARNPSARDDAFLGFNGQFAPYMYERWSKADLEWCSIRMNSTACTRGEVAYQVDAAEVHRFPLKVDEAALRATLGHVHTRDFYVGWSTYDSELRKLTFDDTALRSCLPLVSDSRVAVGPTQWWRVGRAAHAPVAGEPEHIDVVGMLSECHLQVGGRKTWRLRPPIECADSNECVATRKLKVLVAPGEMLCLSIDRLRHTTALHMEGGTAEEEVMNVDVAYDIVGILGSEPKTPVEGRGKSEL